MAAYIFVAVLLGVLNVFNKMVNVKASEYLGNTNGTLINYFEASIISLVILLALGEAHELTPSFVKNVPSYLYLGSVTGLIALIFLVIGTKKSTVMVSTIVVLIGQLVTSIVLDCIFFNENFSRLKLLGILFVIAGMAFREKIIKKGASSTYSCQRLPLSVGFFICFAICFPP